MAIDYRFTADNLIEQQNDDGSYSVHVLADDGGFGKEKTLFDTKVARWYPIAADNEMRSGVPASLTEAFIFAESAGNDKAEGPASDHGLGLMMITAQGLKQGLSDADVLIPENNIKLGTDFLAQLSSKIGSYDPVKLASMYNCGPGTNGPKHNDNAPWGYCEYRIPDTGAYPYISKIVRAYNYAMISNTAQMTGGGFFSKLAKIVAGVLVIAAGAGAGVALADPSILARARRTFA